MTTPTDADLAAIGALSTVYARHMGPVDAVRMASRAYGEGWIPGTSTHHVSWDAVCGLLRASRPSGGRGAGVAALEPSAGRGRRVSVAPRVLAGWVASWRLSGAAWRAWAVRVDPSHVS